MVFLLDVVYYLAANTEPSFSSLPLKKKKKEEMGKNVSETIINGKHIKRFQIF